MVNFLEKYPKLDSLAKSGSNFLITLLSNRKGFDILTNEKDWTKKEL
jgi:hypothetical protein